MNNLTKVLLSTLYTKSFYEFVKGFWNTADPSKFVDGKLIQYYCEVFQYMCREWVNYEEIDIDLSVLEGEIIDVRENKNKLCLMVPPRHTKSLIFNVFGPVWLWISHPIKAVSVSHTSGLAGQMNAKRYSIINSEKFKEIFEDISLQVNTSSFLKDKRGGELYSICRNAFTGYGADIIINDDLTNAETARKDKAEMSNAWAYYRNTMPSRVNDIFKCIILNIQQRLAPNDIAGHIMNEKNMSNMYSFITLPAIFSKKTHLVCPISGDVFSFDVGDTLWPERFGDYQSLRYDVGETIFETQYLQNPIASDRTVIKEHMLMEKEIVDTPGIENSEMIYASHDFPVKDKDSSDFLGSVLAYRVGSNLYIVDCLEKKMAFVKSVEYVTHINESYPGSIQVIEDKANGSPILQQLQDKVSGLQAFQPGTASKMQRLESSSLYFGNVIFVKSKYNTLTSTYSFSEPMENLKQKLLNFPFVEHDDIIDALSMLILFVYMDKKYQVYGRAFNKENLVVSRNIQNQTNTTIFFNKEGDIWKAIETSIVYSEESKIIVNKETQFKGSVEEGLLFLKDFGEKRTLFIDCSSTESLRGMSTKNIVVEKYTIDDFDKSVTRLNYGFAKRQVLLDRSCVLTKSDIESFKFNKSKDETVKYITEKDGFVSCIRMAMHYYGVL